MKNKDNPSPNSKSTDPSLLTCCCKYTFRKIKHMFSGWKSWTFCSQVFIFTIPFLSWLFFVLYYLHIISFTTYFYYDYFSGFRFQFLDSVIDEEIKFITQLNQRSSINRFQNEISNVMFYKIFTKELIRHDFLKGKSISNLAAVSKTYNQAWNKIGDANIYAIPQENAKEHIDENENVFAELNKFWFLFSPLITQMSASQGNEILTNFFIQYTIETLKPANKNYFIYPLDTAVLQRHDNFFELNNINKDPDIMEEIDFEPILPSEENSDDPSTWFFKDKNWFSYSDYMFRNRSSQNPTIRSEFAWYNSVEPVGQKINRYHWTSSQIYHEGISVTSNNPFILNFISKYRNNEYLIENSLDLLNFLIPNTTNSDFEPPFMKYSDNQSYVITYSKITTMTQSRIFHNFFSLGMSRKNNLFSQEGYNYDSLDISKFFKIEKFFNIHSTFGKDIRTFSTWLWYNSFLEIQNPSQDNDYLFYNYTDKDTIYSICSQFDFHQYYLDIIEYNENNKFHCLNKEELYYYDIIHGNKYQNSSLFYYPHCECIPFYCLNIETSNIPNNHWTFTDRISWPKKCVLSLGSYYDWKKNSKSYENKLWQEDTAKIISFTSQSFNYFNYLTVLSVSIIYYDSYNEIKNQFIDNWTVFNYKLDFITIALLIFSFIATLFLLGSKVLRFTTVIMEYSKIHSDFLFSMENKKKEDYNATQIDSNKNGKDNAIYDENMALLPRKTLQDETFEKVNLIDNSLIDDLFLIYCHYYKYEPEKKIINSETKEKKSKAKIKISCMSNENELFQILCDISQEAPRFKFNLNTDLNLYTNRKWNQNYLKGAEKSSKVNKKQIALTQGVVFEWLSTEEASDYGLIVNWGFNYTNNIGSFEADDSIKKTLISEYDHIKWVGKRRNYLLEYFKNCYEGYDEELLKQIDSNCNFFLIEVYYKYWKYILTK